MLSKLRLNKNLLISKILIIMKRKLLAFFAVIAVCASTTLSAQTWTPPTFEHSSDDLSSYVGEVIYLYNVGTKAFVSYGANYGTRAVMGPVGYPAYLRQSGTDYKFEWVVSPKHNGSTYDLFYTGGTVYTDNTSNSDWTCTYDATSQSYTIASTASASTYMASLSTTTNHTANAGNGYKTGGKYYHVMANVTTNDDYAKWRFVTPRKKALLDLSDIFTYVKNTPSLGIDLTSYIATYDNSASTLADLTTALSNLKAEIYSKASAGNPVNITSFTIANPSFRSKYVNVGSMDGWIVSTGTLAPVSSNEIYGTYPSADSCFVEYWQSSGNIPAFNINQTLKNLPAGKYSLVAMFKGNNNGSATPSMKLYAGTTELAITTVTPNTVVIDSLPDITLTSAGDLTIGFQYSTGANWVAVDNFKLYYLGALTEPAMTVDPTSLSFSSSSLVKTFTVNGANLVANATLSAPTGITLDKTSLTPAEVAAGATVTATFDNSVNITGGTISVTSGTLTKTITVTASADILCYTSHQPTKTNIIPDPYLNSLTGFAGWGNKAIVHGSEAYCGEACVKFTATTNTYPTGAALDISSVAWQANHTYRIYAKIKAVDGTFAFYAKGTNPDAAIAVPQSTSGDWEDFTADFTTGASVTANYFSFNNVDNSSTGKVAYIDNWELYDLGETSIISGVKGLNNDNLSVYTVNGKLVVNTNEHFSVYTLQGIKVVDMQPVANSSEVNVNAGVYLVKAGNSVVKAIVK